MTTPLKQNSDELLAQAVCAVFVKDSRATAWLFSEEGHLLTVGHLFAEADPSDLMVEVQFLDEGRLKARTLYRVYNKRAADDFAILKLVDPAQVAHRNPLPVAMVERVEGFWKLQGYGKTLGGRSAGKGEFLGRAEIYSSDDFFFKLDSKQTGEAGFSGSPIFSDELQAVVGIQTEATKTELGAERDTVLAVPLWRIEKQWTKFRSLVSEPGARRKQEEKYKSPKTYLEERITKAYQTLRLSEDQPQIVSPPDETLETKYADAIQLYLRIYFLLCKRIGLPADPGILEIAANFSEFEPEDELPSQATSSRIYTNLPGSRVNVGVSQMFRIADLLTRPESVKARQFYEAITNINKLRRTLGGRKSFRLGALGSLRPIIGKSKDYDSFWNPAIPNFRLPTVQPLCFIPYELSLMKQLQNLRLGSDEESALHNLTTSASIKNSQINGRLRIYPPGIGVISLSLALEFTDEIPIELVAQIAHNIEQLLFVGPNDQKPYDVLMLKIIDRVIDNLFVDEGFSYENRRWTPPVATFSFPEGQGIVPEDKISELAYLMSLAPANEEELQHLNARVLRALRSARWTRDRILAVAGQGVALFFVDDKNNQMPRQRRQSFRLWLTETHELISAAAYAQKAFAEEIDTLFTKRILDESWLPQSIERFNYLKSLLETMQEVMRAIASIGSADGHLQHQGAGALMTFAKDVWAYSNPVDRPGLKNGLSYVAQWLAKDGPQATDEIIRLRDVVDGISGMSGPFSPVADRHESRNTPAQTQELGTGIMDMLTELEEILKKDEPEELRETRYQPMMQQLRKQLGLQATSD
jgi:hypothetical protein